MTNSYVGISDGRTSTGRTNTPDYGAGARRTDQLQQRSLDNYFSALNLNANTAIKDAQNNGSDLKQLGELSKTLTEGLVERQKGINENEMLRGINDAYMNGVSEGELAEADDVANAHAEGEKQDLELISKVDAFSGDRIRKSSSWYEYGLHIGKIKNGAKSYSQYMDAAKLAGPITINGREISPNTTDPGERSAWVAYHRSQFLGRYSQYKPALLSKHLFPEIEKHDSDSASAWSSESTGILNEETRQQAYTDFSNGTKSIADTWKILTNAGMKPGDARKALITRAAELYHNEEISEERYNQIKATPFGRGGTWGGSNKNDFRTAEESARNRNEQLSSLDDRERQRAHDEEAQAALETLQGDHSQEQLETIIKALAAKYKNVKPYAPLDEYYKNSTVEGRSREEQLKRLDSLYQNGDLTVRELNNGMYANLTKEDRQQYMALAQQSEQLGSNSNERVAAAGPEHEAVTLAIQNSLGNPLPGEKADPTLPRAIQGAKNTLDLRARQLRIASGLTWAQAYSQAGKELTAEIEAGRTKPLSLWYVADDTNGDDHFPMFKSNDTTYEQSKQRINKWKELVNKEGRQAFSGENKIFTIEDAKVLSNPNKRRGSAADIRLRTMVNQLNNAGDERITYSEARQMVLDTYGLKTERPFKPTELEIDALDADMLEELYSPYASGPNAVSVQTGKPPTVIREGVQGGQDVVQASVAFGAPLQIAPLAAAVFANESRWGKYTSGNNNLFGIKSTDGTGTSTLTREGDINGPGPSRTELAKFRDYGSRTESVQDFWEFLKTNPRYAAVLTASTPMEALKELKAAGYANSPSYVKDVSATWDAMGIDPNRPFTPQQLTSSPWSNTSTMSPMAAVYITGNIGSGRYYTGRHLDVKRVDGGFFEYDDLDEYVEVDDPDFGRVPLSRVPETGDWNSHTSRGSHGRDYGTETGSPLYLKNGAKVVSNNAGGSNGDYLIIELPNGQRYSFLHGKAA